MFEKVDYFAGLQLPAGNAATDAICAITAANLRPLRQFVRVINNARKGQIMRIFGAQVIAPLAKDNAQICRNNAASVQKIVDNLKFLSKCEKLATRRGVRYVYHHKKEFRIGNISADEVTKI